MGVYHRPTLGILVSLLVLVTTILASSHSVGAIATSTGLSKRRAFFVEVGFVVAVASQPACAYGEFEPGARARKKAAQDAKSASTSGSAASKFTTGPGTISKART
jgi:hypothetical protein